MYYFSHLVKKIKMSTSKADIIKLSAEKLFWKYGYKKVSIDSIVKEAWVAKWTFYLYFKNKDELYLDIFKDKIEEWRYHMKFLAENIESLRDRLIAHMIWSLVFVWKDDIIKNLIRANEDYFSQSVTPKSIEKIHIELMNTLFDNNAKEVWWELISMYWDIKTLFMNILDWKKFFSGDEEKFFTYAKKIATIMVDWILTSDYKGKPCGIDICEITKRLNK